MEPSEQEDKTLNPFVLLLAFIASAVPSVALASSCGGAPWMWLALIETWSVSEVLLVASMHSDHDWFAWVVIQLATWWWSGIVAVFIAERFYRPVMSWRSSET